MSDQRYPDQDNPFDPDLPGYPATPIPGYPEEVPPRKPRPPVTPPEFEEDEAEEAIRVPPDLATPAIPAIPVFRGPVRPAPHPGSIILAGVTVLIASTVPEERWEEIFEEVALVIEGMTDVFVDATGEVVSGNYPTTVSITMEGIKAVLEATRDGELILHAEPAEEPYEPEPIPALPTYPAEPIEPGQDPANDPIYEPPIRVPPPPDIDEPEEEEEEPDEIVIPLPLPERDPSSDPEPYPDTWFPPMAPDPWVDPENPYETDAPDEWEYPTYPGPPSESPIFPDYPNVPGPLPEPYQLPEWHPDYDPDEWWYIPYTVEIEWLPDGTPAVIIREHAPRRERKPQREEERETTAEPTPSEETTPESTPQTEPAASPSSTPSPGSQPTTRPATLPSTATNPSGSVASRVLGRIFGPGINATIATQVGFAFFPTGSPGGWSVRKPRLKWEVKRKPERARERTKHRNEQKMKHQQKYLALLMFVNKYWGVASEVMDMLRILKENIEIDGHKQSRHESFDDIFKKMIEAENIEFDFDSFLIEAYEEALTDAIIGALSQAEKKLILEKFGAGSWVANTWGNPSTQLNRLQKALGEKPSGLTTELVEQAKIEVDRLNKVREAREKLVEKLEDGLLQTP